MSKCTIITDASFCPNTRAAGWASWIVCGDRRIKVSDNFKKLPNNCTQAEFWACVNSIAIACKAFPNSEILIQNDSTTALDWIKKDLQTIKNQFNLPSSFKIYTKHVKGHTSINEPRFYCNRWCDNHAYFRMSQQRNILRSKQKPIYNPLKI